MIHLQVKPSNLTCACQFDNAVVTVSYYSLQDQTFGILKRNTLEL